MGKVSSCEILRYFSNLPVLDHYQEATENVGLWNSEDIVFSKTFTDRNLKLLELGCGAGRISFGLWKKGYKKLTATDFSKPMIKRAVNLNKKFKTQITFKVEDATSLSFDNESFEGAIFGFNGLMQIPGRNNHNAPKLIEKYNNLAREALSSGDKILSESYFQHADHFTRILNEQENIKKSRFSDKSSNEEISNDKKKDNQDEIVLEKENSESLDEVKNGVK